jgi:signal transduction histidine kinase
MQFDGIAIRPEQDSDGALGNHSMKRSHEATQGSRRRRVKRVPAALYSCAPDKELSITFAAEDMREHFGLDPSSLLGLSGSWVERAHPQDASRISDARAVLLDTGRFCSEFRLRLGEDDYRWVQNELRMVSDIDGRPLEVIGYLLDITKCRQAETHLERSSHILRELASHLQSVREAERSAIARAIHDEMGQTLTALKIDLVRLRSRLPRQKQTEDLLSSTLGGVDDVIAAVQRIMAELRPSVLDDLGLVPAVEWYLERFQSRTGIRCRFEAPPKPPTIDKEVATALFRILQESLQNVARHASATRVHVVLALAGRFLQLGVRDNGTGISQREVDSEHSFGLLEIRERAEVFGGSVEIRGAPDFGTSVKVSILLPATKRTR